MGMLWSLGVIRHVPIKNEKRVLLPDQGRKYWEKRIQETTSLKNGCWALSDGSCIGPSSLLHPTCLACPSNNYPC